MRMFYIMAATFVGCTPTTASGPHLLDSRIEATSVLALQALDPADAMVTRPDGLYALTADERLDPTTAPVVAAARYRGEVVATETELLTGRGALLPSPIDGLLAGPVTDLAAAGTSLWLQSEGSWWLYENDALSQPTFGDLPLNGFVKPGVLQDRPVVWADVDGGLVGLASSLEGSVVVARTGLEATVFAVSSDGVWAANERGLFHFDGASVTRVNGDAVTELEAHPKGNGVWVRTENDAYHLQFNDRYVRVDGAPTSSWRGSDASGRLWTLADDGTVERHAASPVGRLGGVVEGAMVTLPFTLVADTSHVAERQSLTVTLDGTDLALDGADSTLVDPSILPAGAHEIALSATWTEGVSTEQTLSFVTEVTGPVTWDTHIEPLYRSNCAVCHDNGTATILIGQDEWITHIDQILLEVEEGRMPIGADALSPATIGTIQAWKDAEFP